MAETSVLFIGGTGVISAACVRRAVELGHRVSVVNRGRSEPRPLPAGVRALTADIRQPGELAAAVAGETFDVVADFLTFTPDQLQANLDLFGGRMDQYVFISSASAYQKPPARLPVTEDTPLDNPFWQYSRDKAACEELLWNSARDNGFGATVVRPSHTYDRTSVPFEGGWVVLDRMRRGLPVVVHGDGSSLWAITHTDDVAVGLVGLLGNPAAHGEAYHLTSDELVTWNQIYSLFARALGVQPRLVHITSEDIAAAVPEWGPPLLGDKTHSMVFDNTKIRAAVPEYAPAITIEQGVREIVDWYLAHPEAQLVDEVAAQHYELLLRGR